MVVIVVFALFPFGYAILSSMLTGNAFVRCDRCGQHRFEYGQLQGYFCQQRSAVLAQYHQFIDGVRLCGRGIVVLGVTAAYALGRVQFKGRGMLLIAILAVSMFPQVAVLAGMFEMMRTFGLYNKEYGFGVALPDFYLAVYRVGVDYVYPRFAEGD